jgi:hypothetical protein
MVCGKAVRDKSVEVAAPVRLRARLRGDQRAGGQAEETSAVHGLPVNGVTRRSNFTIAYWTFVQPIPAHRLFMFCAKSFGDEAMVLLRISPVPENHR